MISLFSWGVPRPPFKFYNTGIQKKNHINSDSIFLLLHHQFITNKGTMPAYAYLDSDMQYVCSLDQSTTSTKFSLFRPNGQLVAQEIIEHQQITPAQGLLEHDPLQIVHNVETAIQRVVARTKDTCPDFEVKQIQGLGITNQRETVIGWDPSGKPYYNAIVWCDTRSKDICDRFTEAHGNKYKERTGLPVSTYFTLFKIIWLAENVPEVQKAIQEDKIRFGTIDTWVVYNLTGKYVTDASNASRTFMCNLKGEWDPELVALAGIKPHMLPQIVDSFNVQAPIVKGTLTGIEVRSILGDQQSSAYAHQLQKDQMKITYGTGCFMLANIGTEPVIHPSFITTILFRHKGRIEYAFEGAVECGGGAINWAKRNQLFQEYADLNHYQEISEEDLYFFPSFGQIYAPFWKTGVKGGLVGLSLATTKEQMVSALLQSILFRVYDNLILKDCQSLTAIYADGGMTKNPRLMQHQSDVINKPVTVRERDTCWGVAKGVLTSYGLDFLGFQEEKSVVYIPEAGRHKRFGDKYVRWCQERSKFYDWK